MASGVGRAAAAAAASCRPPGGSLPPVLHCCPLTGLPPELCCCFWAAFLPFGLPGEMAAEAAATEAERCWLLSRGPEPRLPLPPPFSWTTGETAALALNVWLADCCSIPVMSSCSDVRLRMCRPGEEPAAAPSSLVPLPAPLVARTGAAPSPAMDGWQGSRAGLGHRAAARRRGYPPAVAPVLATAPAGQLEGPCRGLQRLVGCF